MSKLFYHVMQDNLGNLLFDVSGTMRIAGSGTVATIYGDEALTVVLPNPMTNHPSFGSFKCFLPSGDFDFYMAKSGYTFETLTGVQGHGTMAQQDAADVDIIGGTIHNLTALSVLGTAYFTTAPGFGDAPGTRTNLGLGSMAPQNANNVTITGGTITGITDLISRVLYVNDQPGVANQKAFIGGVAAGSDRFNLYCTGTAPNLLTGDVGVGIAPVPGIKHSVLFNSAGGIHGVMIQGTADTGGLHVLLRNAAGTIVGSIACTASDTAFNTSSDGRLKDAIAPLTGALEVIRALNPVSFLWKADGAPGRGFVAQDVATVLPEVVTGAAGAVDEAGQILPQQMDYSKLVPWLVSAVKELTQQVEMLQAQRAAAGV